MKKILVTGNAGSGKSTTAKRIADSLALPYHGLDKIVWKRGWQKASPSERNKKIRHLIKQDAWVIDGVDYGVMEAADTIIFLDIPRRACFRRVTNRNWKYLFKSRPELPENCPEILIIPTLIKIIWRFPTNVRPRIIEEKLKRSASSFIHIQSMADLERYLQSV
jgi:adenylate kinase family enzyme